MESCPFWIVSYTGKRIGVSGPDAEKSLPHQSEHPKQVFASKDTVPFKRAMYVGSDEEEVALARREIAGELIAHGFPKRFVKCQLQ